MNLSISSRACNGNFREDIKINKTIKTKHGAYTIGKLLGEGGYGFVYLVISQENQQQYAMKIERVTKDRISPKLKIEVSILKTVSSVDRERSHFVKMYDRCKKKDYYLIVMDLLGPNIFDLRRKCRNLEFSESTSFNVAIQCLESIEDLHKFNFIHRDIKPTNFSVGMESKNDIVYLIDFGLSRYLLNRKGNIKTPREICRFKGTIRYASRATHKGLENGKKDDVEAWIYMFVEFLPSSHLPWRTLNRLEDVLMKKNMLRVEWPKLFNHSKYMKLQLLLDYIDTLSYAHPVDYNFIYVIINGVAEDNNIDLKRPLDWTIKK